ncbi:MAG: EAL domain-containing protein [Synergistaceae bacterium]|nr:EAL domain-containing protein [Synergistaceae bacterium]
METSDGKSTKHPPLNGKPWLKAVGIPILLLLVIFIVIQTNATQTKKRSIKGAENILRDSAKEQVASLSSTFENQFDLLGILAEEIASRRLDRYEINDTLQRVAERSKFLHVAYTLPSGASYMSDGAMHDLPMSDAFKIALSGKRAIDRTDVYSNHKEPHIVLALPVVRDGKVIGVIHGCHDEKSLRGLIASKAYGGKAYTVICATDGRYLIDTDNPDVKLERGNLFSALAKTNMSEAQLDKLKKDMAAGKGGMFHYKIDGCGRYVVYQPMKVSSRPWVMLNVLPEEAVLADSEQAAGTDRVIFSLIALLSAGIVAIFIVRERSNNRAVEEERESLRISNELFSIAATQNNRIVEVYDIKRGELDCNHNDQRSLLPQLGEIIQNVPQVFFDMGLIAQDSVEEVRSFFKKLDDGEKNPSATFEMRMQDGAFRWIQCDATAILDSAGKPVRAVLVSKDISEQREFEAVYKKWQQSIHERLPETYTLFRTNMSKNAIDSVEGTLLSVHFSREDMTFSERTKEFAEKYVHPDDRNEYLTFLNQNFLLAKFFRGVYTMAMDFRELTEGEQYRWLRITIELVEYPNSKDVEAYLMYEDVDEAKRAELLAKEQAESDPLTGALNRNAFAEQANKILRESDVETQHALLMFDMDGFKLFNDTFGHAAGDDALVGISKQLRSALRRGDLIGRLGGDEFLILLKDIPYDAVVETKAKQMCAMLNKTYNMEVQLSASIGIAVYPRDGEDFDALYKNADAALYSVKGSGKNGFALFSKEMSDAEHAERGEEQAGKGAAAQQEEEPKKRMLIVDDNEINRTILINIFHHEYIIETAEDGRMALIRLRRFGAGIAVVLLDLVMPGIDGFAVMDKMRADAQLQSIPVVAISAEDDPATSLRAIRCGAADFVNKPVDADLVRIRVQSAVSKSENERLRAQNSYLTLQGAEEAKYRAIVDSTGTVLVEYDWANGVFTYDEAISKYIGGNFDNRKLWRIFLSDMIASVLDVKKMQTLVHDIANDRKRADGKMDVLLKTPSGERHWFHLEIYKKADEYMLTDKLLMTFNDVDEKIKADEKLRFQSERDSLTGLYNRATFLRKVEEVVSGELDKPYFLAVGDIDNFKAINDRLGHAVGDQVLQFISDKIRADIELAGGFCGRLGSDAFAALVPYDTEGMGRAASYPRTIFDGCPLNEEISCSIGYYLIEDPDISADGMLDRAMLAKQSVKGLYETKVAWYDEGMRRKMLHEQKITSEMENALAAKQFEVWFQPQYNHSTSALVGAEALVRWRHPDKGMIPPAEFIDVFERSGFIYKMDVYVWEEVCTLLRRWMDEGRSPLPVSVNVSRYDILHDDLVTVISDLMKKYRIPIDLLRLEITETAFSRSSDRIINVVRKFTDLGFSVEIDDFGSGYSSLNILKDVPANGLKLDMRFFEDTGSSQRGGHIIESVVRMAKWLGMSVIAEGVETVEQADYLKTIGCSFVQGYLYAKPMPVSEYEALAGKAAKEDSIFTLETVKNLNNDTFWDPKSMETLVFNSFVGGACILEYHDGEIEVLRANEKYARMVGKIGLSIEDALALPWKDFLNAKELELVRKAVLTSAETKDDVTEEFIFRNLPGGREKTYVRMTMRVIAKTEDRYLIYCTNEDISAQRLAEEHDRKTSDQLAAIMSNVHGGVTAAYIDDDGTPRFIFANDEYFDQLGYTREQFNAEVRSAFDCVLPEDRELVINQTKKAEEAFEPSSVTYRVRKRDGSIAWLLSNISMTNLPGVDKPVYLSVANDITGQCETEEQIRFLNEVSKEMLLADDTEKAINGLLNKALDYFRSERAYVFEIDWRKKLVDITYECCSEGVAPDIGKFQAVPIEQIQVWLDDFEKQNYVSIPDVNKLGKDRADERSTLEAVGLRSFAAVPIRRGDKVTGFFGVDDPTRSTERIDGLVALGNYLSATIALREMAKKISKSKAGQLADVKSANEKG